MKAETAALRNSQYETGEMSTILYFKEEAVEIIGGRGYAKKAAARQNSAFIEAFDGARLAESRVTTGARSADAILISAIFGVQPKPLANGFNGVFKLIPNSKTRSRWSLNGEALLEWTLKSL